MTATARLVLPLLAFAAIGAADGAHAGEPALEPYQMVRSLQQLQDRIADGDHAALPMQTKLLELIDARLRDATDAEFAEQRNVRAALVYGMSGGNPKTLAAVFRRPTVSEEDKKLGAGVLAYLRGKPEEALEALAGADPKAMPLEVGAFLALIKGSVNSAGDPKTALKLFDQARLLSPGTLIEEAALRRSLAIEASLGLTDRFIMAARQYVVRFLRSPYASQFADSFVTGILALHATISLDEVDAITALMDADQRKVIYLRLARRSAIEGYQDLSAFAAGRAEETLTADASDARARLYSSLSTLTSENVDAVTAQLKAIDRQQLAESDIRLLDAAEAVAREVTAMPAEPDADASPRAIPLTPQAVKPAPEQASAPDAPKLATGEGDRKQSDVSAMPETPPSAAEKPAAISEKAGAATAAPVSVAADEADAMVADTRAKLSAIDAMLKEAK